MNTILLYALHMQHQPTGVHVALIIRCVSISIKLCVCKVLKVPPKEGIRVHRSKCGLESVGAGFACCCFDSVLSLLVLIAGPEEVCV